MSNQILWWIVFNIFVLAMLTLDLGIFHRKAHEVKVKEALVWSFVWIALALLFNLGIYFWRGPQTALEFLTGYLIEKSLSVDNIFVFLLIFSYFRVPALYQHKVLFWGILGALIMRAIFIVAGVALIQKFHWMIYIFGGLLILTGIKWLCRKTWKSIRKGIQSLGSSSDSFRLQKITKTISFSSSEAGAILPRHCSLRC